LSGNSHQKKIIQKAIKAELADIISSSHKEEQMRREAPDSPKLDRLTWGLTFISLAVAFGSWGYTVVAPDPNLHLGSALFLIAILFVLAAWWINVKLGSIIKIGASMIAISVFILADIKIMTIYQDRRLIERRTNVRKGLAITWRVPTGEEGAPEHTRFTVTNGGDYEISKRHEIVCVVPMAIGNDGTSYIVGPMTSSNPDGTTHLIWNGDQVKASGSKLASGGDAQSDDCLKWIGFRNGIDCIDTIVVFRYFVEDQPTIVQIKKFRLVAYKGNHGQFSWMPEPIDSVQSYCTPFYHGSMPLKSAF
jgi:hypothetical protein